MSLHIYGVVGLLIIVEVIFQRPSCDYPYSGGFGFLPRDAMLCPVSVRPSVRPSQVGVLLKRLNVGSHKQHHTIAQGLWFSESQRSPRNSTGVTPYGGASRGPSAIAGLLVLPAVPRWLVCWRWLGTALNTVMPTRLGGRR